MVIVNKIPNSTKNLRYSNNSLVFDTTYHTFLKYIIRGHITLCINNMLKKVINARTKKPSKILNQDYVDIGGNTQNVASV